MCGAHLYSESLNQYFIQSPFSPIIAAGLLGYAFASFSDVETVDSNFQVLLSILFSIYVRTLTKLS